MNKDQILHLIANRINELLQRDQTENTQMLTRELSHLLDRATSDERRELNQPVYSSGLTTVTPYSTTTNG